MLRQFLVFASLSLASTGTAASANDAIDTLVGSAITSQDALLQEIAGADLVLIGEHHNVIEVNTMADQIYQQMIDGESRPTLVTEQDPSLMAVLERAAETGSYETFLGVAANDALGLHFLTDSEMKLMFDVASPAGRQLHGIDRALALGPTLRVLREWNDKPEYAELLDQAIARSTQYNMEAFMAGGPEGALRNRYFLTAQVEVAALLDQLEYETDSRSASLVSTLRTSQTNILRYRTSYPQGTAWLLEANEERERLMGANLARVLASGEGDQTLLVKLGHNHVTRSVPASGAHSAGEALESYVLFQGGSSVSIGTVVLSFMRNEVGAYEEGFDAFSSLSGSDSPTIIATRPLRAAELQGLVEFSDEVSRLVSGFDYLIVWDEVQRDEPRWLMAQLGQ